jgi:hypothetical protein
MNNLPNNRDKQLDLLIPLYPDFDYSIETLIELRKQVEAKKLLICGEMHGIKENYEAYLFLIEKLNIKQIGMEIESRLFEFLLNYKPQEYNQNEILESKLRSMNWPDGRVSKSLLSFLRILKQKGLKVFFFDNYDEVYNLDGLSEEEINKASKEYSLKRDYTMSTEILAKYDSKRTLIIAGNYHTNSNRDGSMANFLEKTTGSLPNVALEYGEGQFYNNSKLNPINSKSQITSPLLIHNSDSDFSLKIPTANSVEVF